MHRLALIIALLALGPALAAAQPARVVRAFEEGNQRYAEQDYEAALAAYERALEGGYASGALYYNMGNAHYRLGARGQALRYYEKARLLQPHNKRLLHNLALVRSQTGGAAAPPQPVLARFGQRIAAWVRPAWLFGGGLVLYLLALGLAAYRLWTRRRGAWLRRALILALSAGALLMAVAFTASAGLERQQHAVVVAREAALHATPAATSERRATFREGLVLRVLDRRDGWMRVRSTDGTAGWLADSALGTI